MFVLLAFIFPYFNDEEITLKKIYPDILKETKIDPLTYPQITITKIAEQQDIEAEIKIPVMPEIILGDFKSIAKRPYRCKNRGL